MPYTQTKDQKFIEAIHYIFLNIGIKSPVMINVFLFFFKFRIKKKSQNKNKRHITTLNIKKYFPIGTIYSEYYFPKGMRFVFLIYI